LGQVVLGETGEARSNIQGGEVVVAGKVDGDISTRGKLTITGNGQVDGNVDVAKLIILEGGQLNGSSKMEPAAAAPAPAPTPANAKEKRKKSAQPEAG
ncbi:polymer-forming cytoskeletal protein, partial [Paenibacillus macerans]|uniref:bactofilin family protein n=1 Tax=Paenibacillus macerans TaxID=44252 RepID=UPI002E1CE90E|nr:polymer-forming cytoskeletal protein [Paenibacillus macerans]